LVTKYLICLLALQVISIEQTLKEAFNLRLEIIKFIDMTFLYGCARPTLCVLYEDARGNRNIKTYVIEQREKELMPGPWQQSNVEHGAQLLIPVPAPAGGVLVVGETTVTYLNGAGNVQSVAIEGTQILTYGMIDSDGSRYLLGDNKGNLYVLVLSKDRDANGNATVTGVVMDLLGTTSLPETINYLDNGIVFVGSALGDSQLLRLKESPDERGNYVETLETYSNIGPIVDMCVVTGEKQGQSHLVTCSGAMKDGSLRVIRSGIGIHEQVCVVLLPR
jgi:DNA damage-binding protein 1